MSAPSTNLRKLSLPSAVLRSRATLRLLAAWLAKCRLTPSTRGCWVRAAIPCGGSIMMTSAPRSASRRPHNSPLPSARSRTLTPLRGKAKSEVSTGEDRSLIGYSIQLYDKLQLAVSYPENGQSVRHEGTIQITTKSLQRALQAVA